MIHKRLRYLISNQLRATDEVPFDWDEGFITTTSNSTKMSLLAGVILDLISQKRLSRRLLESAAHIDGSIISGHAGPIRRPVAVSWSFEGEAGLSQRQVESGSRIRESKSNP
jgi:hypothetical protein